jgi:3-hydroxybutyryl-CoA dehydrogenase
MKEETIERVAIVGVGLMGLGIGIEFARFGYHVSLYDTKENFSMRAMEQAREDLDLMVETELITASDARAAYERLHPTSEMDTAVSGADYVVEAVFDVLSLKREIFARLDELCPPPTILATNTTNLRVTDIAAATKHPERILTTHYFQPPQFVPLVEVVGGEKTDPGTVERAVRVLRGLRKKVVVLNKDVNGLVGTRLQSALSDRAQSIIDMGLTNRVEDLDDIISFGFGRRLNYTANFKRLDLIGLDFLYTVIKESGHEVWKPLAERVERGELGMKTGKGFYDWPGDTAKRENRRLNLGLIRLMKQDMAEGAI